MPKKLKIHPNERVDLPDFERAANDYSAESVQFLKRQLVQAWKSYIISGFEIALANQSTSPGEITVYNGHASDRTGRALNEESQVDDARTITLSGASTSFYIEIEFTETDSDSDARAFWDPTHVNASGEEPGKEFDANVATRITPSWEIVTPVSTSGFEVDSNPDSTRIPLAVLHTDSDNEITSSANPGLSTENGAFKSLTRDHSTGDTKIYVTDSKFFPDSGSATISRRDGSVDETVSIVANDRENNIISISAGLTNDYEADSYFFSSGGVERVIRFNEDHSSSHPDQREILWRGDPVVGHSFFYSNSSLSSPSSRGDNNIKNLKEYIDFLSAQLRELKWGHPRTDVTSTAPPSDFSSTNYYSPTGGIQAARANTVSVGDGSNSYGDFNGTDEVPLQESIDFFSSLSSNDRGVIYLKRGIYTLDNVLTIGKELEVIGEGIDNTVISLTGADQLVIDIIDSGAIDDRLTSFKNISFVNTSGSPANIDVRIGRVKFDTCYFSNVTLEDTTSTSKELTIKECKFITDNGLGVSHISLETLENSFIENCMFDESGGGSADTAISDSGTWTNVRINNCRFTSNLNRSLNLANTQEELLITNSKFESACVFDGTFMDTKISSSIFTSSFAVTGTITDTAVKNCKFRTGEISGAVTRGVVEGCVFNASGDATALDLDSTSESIDLDIIGCKFIDFSDEGIFGDEKTGRVRVLGCYFEGGAGNTNGVLFDSWDCDTTTVTDCEFVNIGAVGNSSVAPIFVILSSGAADRVVKIHNNVIKDVSGSSVFGIFIGDSGSSGTSEIQIVNNRIYDLSAADNSAGIFITSSSSPTTEVQISNNKIRALESSANTLYGIYCNSVKNSIISSNVIKDLNNTETSSPDVKGIYINDPTDVQVTGNTITNISMGAAPTDTDYSAYLQVHGVFSNVVVSSNIIRYSGSNDPRAGLLARYEGSSNKDLTLVNNSIICDSSNTSYVSNALFVTYVASTDTIQNVTIEGNNIKDFNGANVTASSGANGVSSALRFDSPSSSSGTKFLRVLKNFVHSLNDETLVSGDYCANIDIRSDDLSNRISGLVFSDNVLDNSVRTNSGFGVQIRGVDKIVAANNWLDLGEGSAVILVESSTGALVTGNIIVPNGNGNKEISFSSSTDYYAHGNLIGMDGTDGTMDYTGGSATAPSDSTYWNQLGG